MLNREFFFREVEKVFLLPHESIIMAILNIDDFSLYNELNGRTQGDHALQSIAQILKAAFKNNQVLMARYSGLYNIPQKACIDCFMILIY